MKMYTMLCVSLVLMNGMTHAKEQVAGATASNVTVVNNTTDTTLYVQLHFHASEQGKNMTTGQAATVCGNNGYKYGFVKKGKSATIQYTYCNTPGVGVTVYATNAPNATNAGVTLTETNNGSKTKYTMMNIGGVSNTTQSTITVTGNSKEGYKVQ